MGRWHDQFKNHAFQKNWSDLKQLIKDTDIDDKTVQTDVEELTRLKKVVIFLDHLIEASDPELVPTSVWDNFNGQCAQCIREVTNFNNTKNINYLKNANNNADNLLSYVRPYVVESGKAARAAQAGFRDYQKSITQALEDFKQESSQYIETISNVKDDLLIKKEQFEIKFDELKDVYQKIDALKIQYFEGSEEELSTKDNIEKMVLELEESYSKIIGYYNELFYDGENKTSINSKIIKAKSNALTDSESISLLLEETEKRINYLVSFYKDVVGEEDENGNKVGGLSAEIESKKKELDDFKIKQEKRYSTLHEQIEGLLPGANSAGLATAYRAMRKSFSKPIKLYSYIFYISVAILFITSFISIIDSIGKSDAWITFVDITDYKTLLSNLSYKLPIALPILWLALFASKRRSEAQRLQQEYAHKEALAKSYQSFKTQIENLNIDDTGEKEELMKKLLSSAIDAVSQNASNTLDRKYEDKLPVQEIAEKVVALSKQGSK